MNPLACSSLSTFRYLAVLAVSIAGLSRLQAANFTWDGGGSPSLNWGTIANWGDDLAPANPTVVTPTTESTPLAGVDAVTLGASSIVNTPWYIENLTLNSGTAMSLTGSALTLRPAWGPDLDSSTHDGRYFLTNTGAGVKTVDVDITVLRAFRPSTTDPTPVLFRGNNGSGMSLGSGTSLILNGALNLQTLSGTRISGSGGSVTMNGVVSGSSGGLAINGGTTAIFNNVNNSFTGNTIVYSGTIVAGVSSPQGATGVTGAFGNSTDAISLGHGAATQARLLTRSKDNSALTIGRSVSLTTTTNVVVYTIGSDAAHVTNYTGTITNGSAAGDAEALTVTSVAGGRVNFTGNITRNGTALTTTTDHLTKSGTGIVALSGANNNWQGNTLVQQGTLLVNGTILTGTNNAQVSSGATLGGNGTLNRQATISDGGILSAGDTNTAGVSLAQTLNLGAGLLLNNTSILNFDLGSTSDYINVTGDLTLDGTLNVLNSGGFGAGSYKLFGYTGTLTNNTLNFTSAPTGFSTSNFSISIANNGVFLNVVPEPGRALLLCAGLSALFFRRRRNASR